MRKRTVVTVLSVFLIVSLRNKHYFGIISKITQREIDYAI